MALGALSLPSVSTGFTSDSKSILPVSIQGMSNQVTMALDNSSMELILVGIFDAIHITALDTLKSFTMLQETIITTSKMISDSLMTLINIAVKDLGLENTQTDLQQTQTNIAEQKKGDKDQDDSLSQGDSVDNGEGKGILTNSFKGGFAALLDKLTPKTAFGKFALISAGLAIVISQFDGLAKIIGDAAKFFKKEVLPRAMKFYENMKEYYTNLFDGLFGDTGFFTVIFQGIGDIKDAIEQGDGKALIVGVKDLLIKGTISAISVLGTAITGIIKAGIGIIDPDADTSDIDEFTKFFNDLPKNFNKEMSDQAKEYQKVLDEKGFAAAQVVAFRQTYDNLIGRSLNGLSNTLGVIFKAFGASDETYDRFMTNDYRFANVKSVLGDAFESLGHSLELMENAIAIFVNDKIDSINNFLPDFMPKIPKMPVKSIEGQNSYTNDEGMRVPMYSELENINVMSQKKDRKAPVDVIRDQILGNNFTMVNGKKLYFEPQESVAATNVELSDMMNNKDSKMKVKTQEIKALVSESNNKTKESVVSMIADNKQITTIDSSSNTTIATDQRVDSIEPSSNALLQYFRT